MKQAFVKVIILTGLLFTLSYNISLANDWNVRPVKLKVIDAVTKQPLTGIKVYYVLTTWYPDMSCLSYFFYPSFIHEAPGKIKEAIKMELTTDKNGGVFFAAKTLDMQCYERVLSEKIVINLDITMDQKWQKRLYKDKYGFWSWWAYVFGEEELFIINKHYKGFFLTYGYKRSDHEENLVKDKYYREKYEKHVLDKLDDLERATEWDGPPEEYTVDLRRADN